MYLELDKNLIENIEDITHTSYATSSTLVLAKDIPSLIEDLVTKINELKEEKEDLERDIRDNYRPISQAEQYDIDNRDFI